MNEWLTSAPEKATGVKTTEPPTTAPVADLDDDATLLQRGERPAGRERVTVKAVGDNRFPGNDSKQAESGENSLFAIGAEDAV